MKILVIFNCDYELPEGLDSSDADEPPSCQDALIGNAARAGVFNVAQMITTALSNCGYKYIDTKPVSSLEDIDYLLRSKAYDLVFNLCESLDGVAQMEYEVAKLIERHNIPMTGNSATALMNCLMKERCSRILSKNRCSVPNSYLIEQISDIKKIPFPNKYIVKPNDQDGSTGIEFDSVVDSYEKLYQQSKKVMEAFNSSLIVQDYIEGREINVAIIDDIPNKFWNCTEIDFSALNSDLPKILNYSSKWDESAAEYKQTVSKNAILSESLKTKLFQAAQKSAKALGIKGYARFDFRVDERSETPYLIDVNPNCDLDRDSGLARSAMFNGINYDLVVMKIVENAFVNHKQKNKENIFKNFILTSQAVYES